MPPSAEYASSDFDIKHRFTFSVTYAIPGKDSPGQLLKGWELNSVITIQSGQPWYGNDQSNNISGTNENTDRWDFFGNPGDFKSGNSSIPFCTGVGGSVTTDFSNPATITCSQLVPVSNPVTLTSGQATVAANACFKAANAINAATVTSLNTFGCYFQGSSVLIPPALGTFGTSARNLWRDPGLRNVDLSATKSFKFQERLTAQFRVEFFNIFNHPNFANPYGASNGFGITAEGDPSSNSNFGCGCATPDQAAGNPVLGSGGNRAIQLGLKLIF